jgi:hypothetical protein
MVGAGRWQPLFYPELLPLRQQSGVKPLKILVFLAQVTSCLVTGAGANNETTIRGTLSNFLAIGQRHARKPSWEEAMRNRTPHWIAAVAIFVMSAGSVSAQKKYDPGATDTEIKIGNIAPYSGPFSS